MQENTNPQIHDFTSTRDQTITRARFPWTCISVSA